MFPDNKKKYDVLSNTSLNDIDCTTEQNTPACPVSADIPMLWLQEPSVSDIVPEDVVSTSITSNVARADESLTGIYNEFTQIVDAKTDLFDTYSNVFTSSTDMYNQWEKLQAKISKLENSIQQQQKILTHKNYQLKKQLQAVQTHLQTLTQRLQGMCEFLQVVHSDVKAEANNQTSNETASQVLDTSIAGEIKQTEDTRGLAKHQAIIRAALKASGVNLEHELDNDAEQIMRHIRYKLRQQNQPIQIPEQEITRIKALSEQVTYYRLLQDGSLQFWLDIDALHSYDKERIINRLKEQGIQKAEKTINNSSKLKISDNKGQVLLLELFRLSKKDKKLAWIDDIESWSTYGSLQKTIEELRKKRSEQLRDLREIFVKCSAFTGIKEEDLRQKMEAVLDYQELYGHDDEFLMALTHDTYAIENKYKSAIQVKQNGSDYGAILEKYPTTAYDKPTKKYAKLYPSYNMSGIEQYLYGQLLAVPQTDNPAMQGQSGLETSSAIPTTNNVDTGVKINLETCKNLHGAATVADEVTVADDDLNLAALVFTDKASFGDKRSLQDATDAERALAFRNALRIIVKSCILGLNDVRLDNMKGNSIIDPRGILDMYYTQFNTLTDERFGQLYKLLFNLSDSIVLQKQDNSITDTNAENAIIITNADDIAKQIKQCNTHMLQYLEALNKIANKATDTKDNPTALQERYQETQQKIAKLSKLTEDSEVAALLLRFIYLQGTKLDETDVNSRHIRDNLIYSFKNTSLGEMLDYFTQDDAHKAEASTCIEDAIQEIRQQYSKLFPIGKENLLQALPQGLPQTLCKNISDSYIRSCMNNVKANVLYNMTHIKGLHQYMQYAPKHSIEKSCEYTCGCGCQIM